jgi:hypothetical protein
MRQIVLVNQARSTGKSTIACTVRIPRLRCAADLCCAGSTFREHDMTSTEKFKGKVVAIAGLQGEADEAMVRLLADHGARLMLGADHLGRLHALACEINAAGGQVHYRAVDAARRASVKSFIAETRNIFGQIDALICMKGDGTSTPRPVDNAALVRAAASTCKVVAKFTKRSPLVSAACLRSLAWKAPQ